MPFPSGASSSPRVALFLPGLAGGGAERVLLNLAAALAAQGCRVDLLAADAAGELRGQIPTGINLIDLHAGRVLRAIRPLAAYLWEWRPIALLSALPHANLVAIRAHRLAHVPTRLVLSEHVDPNSWLEHGSLFERHLFAPLICLTYRQADAIVAVSRGVADRIASLAHLSPGRITVIYNPVVPADLDARIGQSVAHPWFVENEKPVILAVGRLSHQKDFSTLLRAFAVLRQRRPARLVILGEGPERPALQALANHLGINADLDLPGFLPNPFAYMARARLLVLSSKWEGFGNVLAEALACGTPVVSTNCPHGPAEILDNGRFGRLVPVGDAHAMADAIEATLNSPVAGSDLRRAAERFRVDTIVSQYRNVLFGCGCG